MHEEQRAALNVPRLQSAVYRTHHSCSFLFFSCFLCGYGDFLIEIMKENLKKIVHIDYIKEKYGYLKKIQPKCTDDLFLLNYNNLL